MFNASPGENHIFHFNYIFRVSDNFWPQLYIHENWLNLLCTLDTHQVRIHIMTRQKGLIELTFDLILELFELILTVPFEELELLELTALSGLEVRC